MTRVREDILNRLRRLRAELGELAEDVVVVGGSAPATFEFDVTGAEIRPTEDVDLVVRGGYHEWSRFQAALRARAFHHDVQSHSGRMVKDELLVDIMPTEASGVATNRWYASAFAHRVHSSAADLHVLRPIDFLATKLEAFNSVSRPHHGDYRTSRDIEDVITALALMAALRHEVAEGEESVHRFVRYELGQKLAKHPDALTIIEGHMGWDRVSQSNARPLLAWMQGL